MAYKVLSLSDKEYEAIYSSTLKERFADVDFILGCGDLTYAYQEYIVSMLDVPLYYVRGNHSHMIEHTSSGPKTRPHGGADIHRRVVKSHGLIIAGVEGSLRYRRGPFQYSQFEMWKHVFGITPALVMNRIFSGRYLDIFISHAPPWGIHDEPDLPHQGIKAFRWLLDTFQPRYHFHGHIHVYRQYTQTITQYKATTVINTYGYKETVLDDFE